MVKKKCTLESIFLCEDRSFRYNFSIESIDTLGSIRPSLLEAAQLRIEELKAQRKEILMRSLLNLCDSLLQRFSTPVLAPPCSAHFACLCSLNTPDSDHQLIRRKFHEWTVFRLTCSLHSVHCSLLPKHEKSVDVYFISELIYSLIYSRICATPASSHTDETY